MSARRDLRFTHALWVTAWLLLVGGCGGEGENAASGAKSSTTPAIESPAPEAIAADAPEAAGAVPDACVLFEHSWLEQTLGWELCEGEPQDAMPGEYQCSFEMPAGMYVTRTYPDPALPRAVGFSSITISTNPVTAEQFKEFRELILGDAPATPGIGDEAYSYGFDMLYVRVGNRGFSLRIYTDAQSDADQQRVSEVLQDIARKGVAKLRG